MAGLYYSQSIRQLPAGKMDTIKKMFESGAADNRKPDKPPKLSPLVSDQAVQKLPKPMPRHGPKSPVKLQPFKIKDDVDSRKKSWSESTKSGPLQPSSPENIGIQNRHLSPAVSKRVSAFQNIGSEEEAKSITLTKPLSLKPTGIPKSGIKMPGLDKTQLRNVMGIKENDPSLSAPSVSKDSPILISEPKTKLTKDQFRMRRISEPEMSNSNKIDSKNISVTERMKLFEGSKHSVDSDKKSVQKSVHRQNSIGSASELHRSPVHSGKTSPFQYSKIYSPEILNCPEKLQSECEPQISAPPPPRKPPRTHAHDEYLQVKLRKSHEVVLVDNELYAGSVGTKDKKVEGHNTVKDRISKFQRPNSREDPAEKREPPSRPPPPRQRPFSIATDNLSLSQPNTPIKSRPLPGRKPPGKRIENHAYEEIFPLSKNPMPPHAPKVQNGNVVRAMVDEMTPRPLQRFPIRKSFSSDDLFQGGSIPEDPIYIDPSSELCFRDDTYEAFIDDEGYAVPHKFVKRRIGEKRSLDSNLMQGKPLGEALKAKFGGFRKIFADSPQRNSPIPVHEQDPLKVNKRKMAQVKHKLNQAFSALQKYVRRRGEPIPEESDEKAKDPDTLSVDSDSFVDVTEIQRRVEYVSSVKSKTYKSIKKAKEFMESIYPQLFEYAIVVGLQPLPVGYKPYVIHKFPETVDSNLSVPLFCFPDAGDFQPASNTGSESYSFVLTNIDGERVYGYCRRLQPPDSNIPEVICIISPVDAFNMYNFLLNEIEKRRKISLDMAQELIAASFGRPLPKPGKVIHIRTLDQRGEMETLFLDRPADARLDNVNYQCLLNYLGTDKLIKVFSSLLMERRILVCSSNLGCLTHTVHALAALLYPFFWQHIYIPILPQEMLDVCASPTPYLIGILSSHLPQVLDLPLEEVVIVDLDKRVLVRSVGDESTLLPRKLQKALKTAINMCKIDADAETSQWLMVAEAFMRLFIELIGHFGENITTQQDGKKVFLKERFISCVRSKGMRQVLEWFTETQMFEVFITNHLEKTEWGTVDLFMTRLVEYQRGEDRNPRGFGQKMKNFGKALKTKLGQT